MAKRGLFLGNTPVDEALAAFLAALDDAWEVPTEQIPTADSLNRVTSGAVHAHYSSPPYNAAAMDGIAAVHTATSGAAETLPVNLKPGIDYSSVNTGDPVRPPYDTVIMAEDVQENDDGTVTVRQPAPAWQHVRPVGEDIVAGEMILSGGHVIRPFDIGVLLSAGVVSVNVICKPSVAIFPTGNEVVEPGPPRGEGEVPESNSRMLAAMVSESGGVATRFAAVPDDPALLEAALKKALAHHDMVLVNAGSSAGTEDHTRAVLEKLGRVVVHGVAMKPGKPVILAVAEGVPVLGIPGYPVSAYLAFRNFAAPVLAKLAGRSVDGPETMEAVMAKRVVSRLDHREYVRVKVGSVDGKPVATPLARGAGAAMSLVRADGFCVIPRNSEGVEEGKPVRVELMRGRPRPDRVLVSTGSHDLILDIIADMMSRRGYSLSGTHVGSTAGLAALKRGECHIAPVHLLDEVTGTYNNVSLKRILAGLPAALIKGVGREQGLIVAKGNPLKLFTADDLAGVRFVNRQRGSGTRLFLDHKLREAGVTRAEIDGYGREAPTHMAVAAAVKSGSADAGLGIASAAAALDLDFVTLGTEEYDFALPARFAELPQIKMFAETLTSSAFRQRLSRLAGYTPGRCGEIVVLD